MTNHMNHMRKLATLAAAIMALAIIPSTASASWYISKAQAEHATRVIVHEKYGDWNVGAYCRPYARTAAHSGYIYHRFVCYWAADARFTDGSDADCEGTLAIAGSRVYAWQYLVLRGEHCS